MKRMMALMALMMLSACDYAERKDTREEREDRQYRSAMADYKAGRLDAAIKGFENAIHADPGNASARFQLACLMQDYRKDYIEAFCGYHEFIKQHPKSDRVKLAKDRMALCEKALAMSLAEKHSLTDVGSLNEELEAMRKEAKSSRDRIAALEKDLQSARERVDALSADKKRMLAAIRSEGEDESVEPAAGKATVKAAKDLLEEDGDGDRVKMSDEIASLRDEEKDEVSASSALLPERKPGEVEARDAARAAAEKSKDVGPKHPETYVVQEGDTLYRIATRFYGTLHAWKRIKDANKALISSDGRLRAGDTIKLP